MNTKGTKFLAVLAVLAMAFSVFAVIDTAETEDAATSVVVDGLTFDFSAGPAGIAVGDIQNVTAEVSGNTITLKGTLIAIEDPSATATAIEALGYDAVPDYGIAFTVAGLPDGAKAKITNDWWTPAADPEDCFVAIGDARATGALSIPFIIDMDGNGTADKTLSINIDNLIKYKGADDKYYFELGTAYGVPNASVTVVQDAEFGNYEIADGKTLNVDNGKTLTVKAGSILTVTGTLSVTGTGIIFLENGAAVFGNGTYNPANIKSESGTSQADVAIGTGYDGSDGKKVSDAVTTNEGLNKDSIVQVTAVAAIDGTSITVDKNNLTMVAGAALAIGDLDLTIKTDKVVSFTGFTSVSGSIKTGEGASAQTITLDAVEGNFSVYKGSVVIDGEIGDGEIKLDNGVEAKILGTVIGDFVVSPSATATSAKLIVASGAELEITGSLTVNAKVTTEISGKVSGAGAIVFNDNAKILNGGELVITDAEIAAGKTVTTESGSKFATDNNITGTGKIVAMSGSDINGVHIADATRLSGKDASSGTWTFADGVLTLTNYNGTYNFKPFSATINTIILSGENTVSYAPEAYAADTILFGAAALGANFTITTVQGTGALTINVDISAIDGANLGNALYVIKTNQQFKVDAASVAINVTGTNNQWTEIQKGTFAVVGVNSAGADLYNADFDVDVLSTYTAAAVKGIDAGGAAFDIRSCDDIVVKSAGTGIYLTDKLSVKATDLRVTANKLGIHTAGFDVTNAATVSTASGIEATGIVNVTQDSTLTVTGLDLSGSISNNGTISIFGNSTIYGNVTNNATMNLDGVVAVYDGDFVNNATLINNATFNVFAKKAAAGTALAISITDVPAYLESLELNQITLYTVTIDASEENVDGTYNVTATLAFKGKDGVAFEPKAGVNEFTGKYSPSQVSAGYTLELSNATARVTVVYAPTAGGVPQVGGDYSVSVSGTLMSNADVPNSILTNKVRVTSPEVVAGAAIATDVMNTWTTPADGKLVLVDGTMTNTGSVALYVGDDDLMAAEATYEGPISIYYNGTASVNLAGTFNGNIIDEATANKLVVAKVTGNITSKRAVDVSASKVVTGNITAKGAVDVKGTVKGDIVSEGNVTLQKAFEGNVTMKTANSIFSAKGTAAGTLTYVSEYKATKDATAKTEYTATLDFAVNDTALPFEIVMAAGADATESTAVIPGFFKFGTLNELEDKTVSIKATSGTFGVPTDVILKTNYELVIEAGATIEVAKTAKLDVTASALQVSKDAVKNFETVEVPVTYGKVVSIMSFDIDGGNYTIYSNVAYALSNCDENADINVIISDTITQAVDVKKGVNVIVPNGVTLTFDGKSVTMQDGAKITVTGTGKVVFNLSGNNGYPADKDWEFYSVSGNVVFEDNVITFDGVRFSATSTIQGVAATETEPAKANAVLLYNQGTATLTSGVAVGTLTLGHDAYPISKADDDAGKNTQFFATFIVADGTTLEANGLNDAAKQVDLDAQKKITNVDFEATKVTVNGTMKVLNSIIVNGIYDGVGQIILTDGKYVRMAAPGAEVANAVDRMVEAVMTVKIADAAGNGYVLDGVSPVDTQTLTFTAEKVATVDAVTLAGQYDTGKITALATAQLKGLTVAKGAELKADIVNINTDSKSDGKIYAKTMNMRTADVLDYAVLDYQATYVEDGYTVYTYFANIDLTKVSDVAIEKDYNLPDSITGTATITIKDGVTAHISANTVIGVAPTELGAGIVIKGTIMIDDNKFVIVYPGVDISGAKFVRYGAAGDSIVNSVFDIEGTAYATVYANKVNTTPAVVQFDDAAALMNPQIKGYTFTSWKAYNDGGLNQNIGVCNVTASLVAQKVTVKATFLDGVQYYCNGVLYDAVGIDNKVTVGSVFTAKIVDYSKYQGTPLVNGQNAFEVTENVTLTVTGVSPVTPEPQPEPQPAGMTLTEILLIVLVILIAVMVVVLLIRLNRS